MKEADAFIKSSEISQITSPVIQATLQANWYYSGGVTRASNDLYLNGDAIVFQNKLIYNTRMHRVIHADTTLDSGLTLLGMGNTPISASAFYNNGSTLIWRYIAGDGGVSSAQIYQLNSSDGYNWGGSELIQPLSQGNVDMTITNINENEFLLYVPQSDGAKFGVGLYYFKKNVTWGSTLISAGNASYVHRTSKITCLGNTNSNVVYYENQNQIPERTTIKLGYGSWAFNYQDQYSVKRFRWDGGNMLPLDDFYPLTMSEFHNDEMSINQAHISNITKGQSTYYMALAQDKAQDLTELSGTSNLLISTDIYLLKSPDGINWSNGLYIASTRSNYYQTNFWTFVEFTPVVVVGVTNKQDIVRVLYNDTIERQLGYGSTPIMICEKDYTFGATAIDISNDLISYNNMNNQRISLLINNNAS